MQQPQGDFEVVEFEFQFFRQQLEDFFQGLAEIAIFVQGFDQRGHLRVVPR